MITDKFTGVVMFWQKCDRQRTPHLLYNKKGGNTATSHLHLALSE
ncbi:hypothetical protein [Nostoc piscinale]|nr:hypothetical protein [Nostoc piscinale]